MREFLYVSTARIFSRLIGLVASIGNAITGATAYVFNGVTSSLMWLGELILIKLDAERFNHTKAFAEQFGNLAELDVLKRIGAVKDSVLRDKVWTHNHTIAINQLGRILHLNFGWHPRRVHQYLRGVVEQIPGLTYYAGDDIEDGGGQEESAV